MKPKSKKGVSWAQEARNRKLIGKAKSLEKEITEETMSIREEKDNWKGKCHACGKKKTPEQLTKQNGMVCQKCYDKHIAIYKKNKKVGKHNSPVIFCQDCQSQFKLIKTTATDPFEDWDENVSAAGRLHEGIPYQITPLYLTRWKCNCKRQPIITIGMNYHNWAEGYIEQRAKETKEWDAMSEEERDELEKCQRLDYLEKKRDYVIKKSKITN